MKADTGQPLSGTRTATEALEAFNHAFERGDVNGLMAVFAEDAVFEANGAIGSEGAQAIGEFHESVFQMTEPRRIDVHRVGESGDSVLAEVTFDAVMRETGAYVRLPLAVSVTVGEDGRIVRFAEHFDAFPNRYFDGELELGARDLLSRFWESFASRDTDAALQLLSWDCVYNGPLSEHGAAGSEDVRQWLATAPADRGVVAVQITDVAGDNATAFAEGWQIQDGGGDSDRFRFFCILEARAGKIVALTEYLDTSRFRQPEGGDLEAPPTGAAE